MQKTYDKTKVVSINGARIAIVQAKWHSEHTDKMIAVCMELLEKAGCAAIEVHQVPGSYEIPLAAKLLAKQKKYDAIAVFGALVKGDTDHYHVILETCIRELGKVMYDYEIPIIMELLPVHKLEHLIARTQGDQNKGIEAAQATIDIISWRRTL